MSTSIYALGIGVGTQNASGDWLEIFYPLPLFTPTENLGSALDILACEPGNSTTAIEPSIIPALAEALAGAGETGLAKAITPMADSQRPLVAVVLEQDTAPVTVPEAYLKLHLLSHRLVKPHDTDLNGLFDENVVTRIWYLPLEIDHPDGTYLLTPVYVTVREL